MKSIKILQLLKLLADTAGTNDKIELLNTWRNDYVIQKVFYMAYSPKFIYGIKKHQLQEPSIDAVDFEHEDAIDRLCVILNALHNREYTGNAAKRILSNFLSGYTHESQQLILNIINHDLRCGMNVSNINKAIPNHIELAPPYQRCSLLSSGSFDKFGKEFYSQVKADGMFLNLFIGETVVTALTRNGNEFPIHRFTDFYDIIKGYGKTIIETQGCAMWLTGEIVIFEDGVMMPREKSNGMANKILKDGDVDFSRYTMKFYVWDAIPHGEFLNKGKWNFEYINRLSILRNMLNKINAPEYIELIETVVVSSYEEAYEHYLICRKNGLEGTVIKDMSAPWIDGTSKFQIKMKAEVEIDLEMISLNAGKGKNADLFGSVLMRSSCGFVECNVSGFSDEMRKDIFENFDEKYRGRIATVCSNTMTQAKGSDIYRLFLPRFITMRFDKNDADDLERIKAIFESKL